MSFNTSNVISFYRNCHDPEHRDYSYDLCFDVFENLLSLSNPEPDDIDLMALNLGMYLASWGMYRGSSALLQRCSYKVHIGAVNILLDHKYRRIYKISPTDYRDTNNVLILDVFDRLSKHYDSKGVSPTDTLITKILLVTLGCTMALDTIVKDKIGQVGITQKFGIKHLLSMKEYYDQNKEEIDNAVSLVGNPKYHILKCMDMSFIQFGFLSSFPT